MVRKALTVAGAGFLLSFVTLDGALGQSNTTTPRFDAAEVHRSASATNPQTYRSGGFLRGERYDLRKATMMDLIKLAYGFEPDTVFGGPDWLEFDRFDIAAKAPPATSPREVSMMLQSLLADRFKLKFHKDVRPMPVFALKVGALTVGKGPKMNKADGSGDPECTYQRQPATLTLHGVLLPKPDHGAFCPATEQHGGGLPD